MKRKNSNSTISNNSNVVKKQDNKISGNANSTNKTLSSYWPLFSFNRNTNVNEEIEPSDDDSNFDAEINKANEENRKLNQTIDDLTRKLNALSKKFDISSISKEIEKSLSSCTTENMFDVQIEITKKVFNVNIMF